MRLNELAVQLDISVQVASRLVDEGLIAIDANGNLPLEAVAHSRQSNRVVLAIARIKKQLQQEAQQASELAKRIAANNAEAARRKHAEFNQI